MNTGKNIDKMKNQKSIELMTHVVVGYPSLSATKKLVRLMDSLGVAYVELQIPFSDPLADGPTIMKACESSLKNGTTVKDAFVIAKELSKEVKAKLLFMAYFNTVFRYSHRHPALDAGSRKQTRFRLGGRNDNNETGVELFCRDAKAAGITGLIVPDMPLEEEGAEHFSKICKKYGLYNIRVLSPASTRDRIKKNAKVGTGLVYCTARQGITGVGKTLDPKVIEYLQLVKKEFSLPLAVGFGISKKEHIDALRGIADIAVVGSALIDVISESNNETMAKNVRSFIESLGV